MPDLVDLVIEGGAWDPDNLSALAEQAARVTLSHQGIAPDGYEIVLLACDDARIAALNARFRDKPTPTNVLSWPEWDLSAQSDGGNPAPPPDATAGAPESLGNIALSHDTCLREARAQGKSLDDHATHLVVHSTLHLLGYDHIRAKDAALMEEIEIAILASMGIANPYVCGAGMPL